MIGQLPPSRRLPTARRYAARRQLEGIVDRRRALPRRRRLIVGVAIAVLLGSAAAGITLLRSAPVTDKQTARCYTVAELGSGQTFSGTTIAVPGTPGTPAQVDNAFDFCSGLWRQGFLIQGATGIQRPKPNTVNPVPPLIACTLPSGIAGIFPGGSDTCAKLGLPIASR
jgi:uncharacterized membrane protein